MRFDIYNHSVFSYKKQVTFVWLAVLPANQDFRGFRGTDSEGISVWVSAKPCPLLDPSAPTGAATQRYIAGDSLAKRKVIDLI
jgi:hypothetical protein